MHLQFLSILVYASFSTSISFAKPPKVPPKEGEIGEFFWRPATREVVKLLKNSMNVTVNPCDNFYEFACGNYGKKSDYSPKNEIMGKIEAYMKDLLIHQLPSITGSKVVKSVSQLMQSCLNYKRTLTRNAIYRHLVDKYTSLTLRELFSELANYDMHTSFASTVVARAVDGITIQMTPPNDIFAHANYDNMNKKIIYDTLRDEGIADAVIEYNQKIRDIIKKREKSTYKPQWIDVDEIIRNMDESFINTDKVIYTGYFEQLDKLISETGEEVVRAHTLMKAANAVRHLATDTEINETQEDLCVHLISKQFPIVVSSLLSQEFLPEELSDGVKELFDNVLDAIVETVEAQEWLGLSRETALKKMRAADIWLAIPTPLHNYTALDSYYEAFTDFDDHRNFGHQYWKVLQYKQKEKVAAVKKPAVYGPLYLTGKALGALKMNAGNLRGQDLTVYTMGMLQSPLFYYRFPAFFRYGLLGSVFGHEYGHGLASNKIPGPYFTVGGSVSEATKEEFGKRAQCLIDQFDNDTVVSIEGIQHKVSGLQYLNENIADNSGNHVAFQAYKKCSDSKGREKILEEMDGFTGEQLFFVSSAQSYCNVVNEEYVNRYAKDPHAPGPLRVNSYRNSDEFAKAFKCPVGSKMNPLKKCRLWD